MRADAVAGVPSRIDTRSLDHAHRLICDDLDGIFSGRRLSFIELRRAGGLERRFTVGEVRSTQLYELLAALRSILPMPGDHSPTVAEPDFGIPDGRGVETSAGAETGLVILKRLLFSYSALSTRPHYSAPIQAAARFVTARGACLQALGARNRKPR